MAYNLTKDFKLRNSTLCASAGRSGYEVVFNDKTNFKDWSTYNGVTCIGVWESFLFATVVYPATAYIQKTSSISPSIDAARYDHIKIRMKVSSSTGDRTAVGKIQWKLTGDVVYEETRVQTFNISADDEWHVVDVDLTQAKYWVGSVNGLRVFPDVDGFVGDEVFISYIKAVSVTESFCTDSSCSSYTIAGCGGEGSNGYCLAGAEKTSFTIVKDVSDELIVNVDGYGSQTFTLPEVANVSGSDIARILEKKLSELSIGGYLHIDVSYLEDLRKLKITSGTRASDSSILLEWSSSSAGSILGFFNSSGDDISTYVGGTDPSAGFTYLGTYKIRTLDFHKLYDGDILHPAFAIDPSGYTSEAGRRDYALVSGLNTIDAGGKTIIDFNHPVTDEGTLTKFFVRGQLVSGSSKYKIFRPFKNGTLSLVAEGSIGTQEGGKFYTARDDVYVKDISVDVRPGDLLGVYNAVLYSGRSPTGDPDASYYLVTGDATGTITVSNLSGKGDQGIGLYARSDIKQDRAVIDVDCGSRKNITAVYLYGSEDSSDDEYNVAIALDASPSVIVTESHYHYEAREQSDGSWVKNTRTNSDTVINVGALVDGIQYADNGIAGAGFEVGSSDATYMYINGDFEWPNEEFPPQPPPLSTETNVYGFEDNPFKMTVDYIGYNLTKNIHKTIIYFKDDRNITDFQLEYYLEGLHFGDGSFPDYKKIPAYSEVFLDDVIYPDNDSNSILYANPTNGGMRMVGNSISNPTEWAMFNQYRYHKLEHVFDTVSTSRLQLYCTHHLSTKISEFEIYSKTHNSGNIDDNISILFSDYGTNVGEAVIEQLDNTVEGVSVVRGIVGFSPRYIRIVIEPSSTIYINELDILPESDGVLYGDDGRTESVTPGSKRGDYGEITQVSVMNNYDAAGDLYVNIGNDSVIDSGLVLGTSLSSVEEMSSPAVGPGGTYYMQSDRSLRVSDNVAIYNNTYALNDVGVGAKIYKSITGMLSWDYVGTINLSKLVGVTNSNSNYTWAATTYCAVDLGKTYYIDVINIYGSTLFAGLWSTGTVMYSSTDTGNPMDVVWGNATATNARWVRFNHASANPAGGSFYELKNLRVFPSIYVIDPTKWHDCKWTSLGKILTDGNYDTYIDSTTYPVVCIDLGRLFNISGHSLIGRTGGASDWGNSESNFSYSQDAVGPGSITWSSYGSSFNPARWVAVKNTTLGEILSLIKITPSESHKLTEHASWFTTDRYSLNLVSTVSGTGALDEGVVWGESGSASGHEGYNALDSSDTTYWAATGSTNYLWRRFATVTSSGVVTVSSKNIKRVDITIPSKLWSVLDDYSLLYLPPGLSPTTAGNWVTIETYANKSLDFGFDPDNENLVSQEFQYSNVSESDFSDLDRDITSLVSHTFTDPITCDGIKISITGVYSDPRTSQPDTTFITQLAVYEAVDVSDSLVTVSESVVKPVGSSSLRTFKLDYSYGDILVYKVGSYYANMGKDLNWSSRDFLSFSLYVDNVNNLDTSVGGIIFGTSQTKYYKWYWSSMALVPGWNTIKLKFLDADEDSRASSLRGIYYTREALACPVDFINDDMQTFIVEFRGNNGASVSLIFDGLDIVRNRFDDVVRFGTGAYLNNDEYISFPITDIDLFKGTVEFNIRPDWDYLGYIDGIAPKTATLFRIYNTNNDVMSLVMKQGRGLGVTVLSEGAEYYFQPTTPVNFVADNVYHVSVVWSNDGTGISSDGSSIRIYVDGDLYYKSFGYYWNPARVKGSQFIIGGKVSDKSGGVLISSTGRTLSGQYHSYGGASTSCWAVLEHLKVYNYCKTDYTDINDESFSTPVITPGELVEISSDGLNFYSKNNINLPLVFENVLPGSVRTVYVRTNIPRFLSGAEKRTAYIVTSLAINV